MNSIAPVLLELCGLTRTDVVRALAPERLDSAKQIVSDLQQLRRARAKAFPVGIAGRCRAVPDDIVAAMHVDYLETRSLKETGRRFGRTKQGVRFLFRARGLKIFAPKRSRQRMIWGGRTYFKMRGYWADTATHEQLQRKIWREAHGEIPPGHVVILLDGDEDNLALRNLACVPVHQAMFRGRRRRSFLEENNMGGSAQRTTARKASAEHKIHNSPRARTETVGARQISRWKSSIES